MSKTITHQLVKLLTQQQSINLLGIQGDIVQQRQKLSKLCRGYSSCHGKYWYPAKLVKGKHWKWQDRKRVFYEKELLNYLKGLK